MKIHIERKRVLGMFFACILVTALFVFFGLFNLRESALIDGTILDNDIVYWLFKILCIIFIPIMVYATVNITKMLFSKNYLIEMNSVELIDNSSALSLGAIRWSDMERAYIKGQFLTIELKNPEDYISRANPIKKLLINSNIKMGFGPICISPVAFQSQTKEFLDGFSRYMRIDNYLPKSPDTNEETDAEHHESSDI
jgi:hypothetical protein